MRTRSLALTLAAGLLACAGEPPRRLVIRAGRLVDGTGAPARPDMRVVVEEGNIVSVAPDDGDPIAAGPDTAVIDARTETVLPGLVNAHTHLFNAGSCAAGAGTGLAPALRNLAALVRGGVTTVADLAAPAAPAIGLRSYVGTARGRGPRVLVSGPLLTAPGGYLTDLGEGVLVDSGVVVEVASAEEGRARVRELAESGVDLVKVGLQEMAFDGSPLPLLEAEALCAIVGEAHAQELRAVAHAVTNRGIALALDCGVDAVMHGGLEALAPALVARLGAAAVPLAPTLFVFEAPLWGPRHLDYYETPEVRRVLGEDTLATVRRYAALDAAGGEVLPELLFRGISRARAREAVAALHANLAALHRAGVPLGLGTDGGSCMNPLGSPVLELERWVAAGLSPLEALGAATAGGARLLGLHEALGRIAPGYRADIIVVGGRPDERLSDLSDVRRVIIDGIEQPRDWPSWSALPAAAVAIGWKRLGG